MKDCPVDGCETRVDAAFLMCRTHWYSVPKDLRDRVWKTFRNGAGIYDEAYLDAAADAIDAAERKAA